MALKRGLVTMSTRMPVPCTGGYQFGSRRFRCWKPEGHGSVTLSDAIKVSCDVYFYQLGLRLGADSLLAGGAELGFDDRSGIDLERERSSSMLSTAADAICAPPSDAVLPDWIEERACQCDGRRGLRRWTRS